MAKQLFYFFLPPVFTGSLDLSGSAPSVTTLAPSGLRVMDVLMNQALHITDAEGVALCVMNA